MPPHRLDRSLAKAKSAVIQMDLAYAEARCLLALHEANSQKIKSKFNVEVQIASVSSFIAELLSTPVTESGTVTLASTGAAATVSLTQTPPSTASYAVVPAWNGTRVASRQLARHVSQSRLSNRVKAVLFEFLARAFLLSKLRAKSPFTATETERIAETSYRHCHAHSLKPRIRPAAMLSLGQLEFLHFLSCCPRCQEAGVREARSVLLDSTPDHNVSGEDVEQASAFVAQARSRRRNALQGRDAKLDKALSRALDAARIGG